MIIQNISFFKKSNEVKRRGYFSLTKKFENYSLKQIFSMGKLQQNNECVQQDFLVLTEKLVFYV